GGARRGARLLSIGARVGPRKDVAHFAHFEDFRWDDAPGQVLIARGQAGGWSWCIPLQERLSIGIVLNQDDAARLGRGPEERLDRGINIDPWLCSISGERRRETGGLSYSNLPLISKRCPCSFWGLVARVVSIILSLLSPSL